MDLDLASNPVIADDDPVEDPYSDPRTITGNSSAGAVTLRKED